MTVNKPLSQLAKDLGVSEQTLRTWRRQAVVERGLLDGLTSEQLEELRRLRRENRTLQMEREVLRKGNLLGIFCRFRGLCHRPGRWGVSESKPQIGERISPHRWGSGGWLWRVGVDGR